MRKAICKMITVLTLLSISLGLVGCKGNYFTDNLVDSYNKNKDESTRVGIDRIHFVSATGDKYNTNIAEFHNHWGMFEDTDFDESLLSGDKAMELIDEIIALPEVYGDKDEQYAYSITLEYYDDNHVEKSVYRYGYGGFPDNWSKIVADINEVTKNTGNLSDSTDLVTIDADYLRANYRFDLHEDDYPEGVTLEDVIAKYPVSYYEVYGFGYSVVDVNLGLYLYDYYDLPSHKLTQNSTANSSDYDDLLEFADKYLDSVYNQREVSVIGKYKDWEFEIVKLDKLDEWKNSSYVTETVVNEDDGTLHFVRDIPAGLEGMTCRDNYDPYLDPSGRFVIVTNCRDYNVIHEFLTEIGCY